MCVDYRRLSGITDIHTYLMLVPCRRNHILRPPLLSVPVSFGLHGVTATFQCMMDCTNYKAAYLDDVVIHSTSWEDHICHIRSILQRLGGRGSRSSPRSASWIESCSYLGHVVGNGELRPEDSKLQAVESFPDNDALLDCEVLHLAWQQLAVVESDNPCIITVPEYSTNTSLRSISLQDELLLEVWALQYWALSKVCF